MQPSVDPLVSEGRRALPVCTLPFPVPAARNAQPTETAGQPAEALPTAEDLPFPVSQARNAQPDETGSEARIAQPADKVLPFPVSEARNAQPADTWFL